VGLEGLRKNRESGLERKSVGAFFLFRSPLLFVIEKEDWFTQSDGGDAHNRITLHVQCMGIVTLLVDA